MTEEKPQLHPHWGRTHGKGEGIPHTIEHHYASINEELGHIMLCDNIEEIKSWHLENIKWNLDKIWRLYKKPGFGFEANGKRFEIGKSE